METIKIYFKKIEKSLLIKTHFIKESHLTRDYISRGKLTDCNRLNLVIKIQF